jgi:hypothetical protein
MIVHLIDGTYELFRHFYGLRSFNKGNDKPFGAVAGVLHSVLEMIETGATHIGVATDHVIESFRNELWPDYKTGEGIEPELWAQFHPLEEALAAMGVAVWPMTDLEADDGLASAARLAAEDPRVEKVCIWANDKDLAQCVRDDRVVQIIRKGCRSGTPTACGRSSASSRRSSLTCSRSSATLRMGIRAFAESVRLLPRHCSTGMDPSSRFPLKHSASTANAPCCSRHSPRSRRMRLCSPT